MKKTKIIKKALSLVLCCALIFVTISSLTSCELYDNYSEEIGWDGSEKGFHTWYFNLYNAKIQEMLIEYELQDYFELVETRNERSDIKFHFYSEEYTLMIDMFNDSRGYAKYNGVLYCYNIEDEPKDYSEVEFLVNFLNEFTNYVAYDTITDKNKFEEIYYELLASGETGEFEELHYDSLVGSTAYYVSLHHEYGVTYAMEPNDYSVCYKFMFEGLLKPLEE